MENYYHSVGKNIETNKNEMTLSHGNPLDLNIKNKRGYDIINGKYFIEEKINSKNKNNIGDINMAQKKAGQYYDNWEKIKSKPDANNTVSTKPIYKQPYDYSDVEKNFEKFLQNRKNSLFYSKTINKSEGNFMKENNFGFNNNRNSYTAADYITRTNSNNFKKNNSAFKNDMRNRIDNNLKYNKIDKNKFFGYSFLIKK